MDIVTYQFPLNAAECGAMMGNGTTGEMIWGAGNILNITLGSGELWDHRGGLPWTETQNFADIKQALYDGDLERMRGMFTQKKIGNVRRQTLIPIGRLVITLPDGAVLLRYEQFLKTGEVKIFYQCCGKESSIRLAADMSMQDALAVKGITSEMGFEILDSYALTAGNHHQWLLSDSATLEEQGFVPPEKFSSGAICGFVQQMPADPAFAMVCRKFDDDTLTLTYRRNIRPEDAEKLTFNHFDDIYASSEKYFAGFWQDIPQISRPGSPLEQIYYHGLHKFAIMTNPAGVPAGLQGPWFEDDRLPPWGGDYHFNINVQMCYSPALKAGKFANLKRLFDMVLSWKERLRRNAFLFAGTENGIMLAHAVDDTGLCKGGFWTGAIDHASTAWVGMMMFEYCEYSGDTEFLRDEVYDFMKGALLVFEAMLEENADGSLTLPVSISPEYRDARIDAWGRNSSFQLAAIHRLAENLLTAAEILGIQPYPGAVKIKEKLPQFSLQDGEIALWENLLLEESHRHHSHLAGITPFCTIDPFDPAMRDIVEKSIYRLTVLGMGQWVGWCMPWASQIYTRCGNGNMAELILKIWEDGFTNDGGGSLHDGRYKGFTMYAQFRGEVMQMDGGMGAVAAIQDQFLHVYNGELRAFYGVPPQLRGISFSGMCAPDGMKVSGEISENGTVSLEIYAAKAASLAISVPGSEIFRADAAAGETISLVKQGNTLCRR